MGEIPGHLFFFPIFPQLTVIFASWTLFLSADLLEGWMRSSGPVDGWQSNTGGLYESFDLGEMHSGLH